MLLCCRSVKEEVPRQLSVRRGEVRGVSVRGAFSWVGFFSGRGRGPGRCLGRDLHRGRGLDHGLAFWASLGFRRRGRFEEVGVAHALDVLGDVLDAAGECEAFLDEVQLAVAVAGDEAVAEGVAVVEAVDALHAGDFVLREGVAFARRSRRRSRRGRRRRRHEARDQRHLPQLARVLQRLGARELLRQLFRSFRFMAFASLVRSAPSRAASCF
mmetsp:Transcript_17530/g.53451  ORF Transcript_17530/g.53451 Transcript_17530/m.53451 type:complete len:213 (+) Transcript_17530:124-762(+)